MVSTVTSTTFSQTYKDDFADSDNYYRILFNSGRALQARELTQLQTIIQREAERHARFVFREGGAVSSGAISVNNRYQFIKLNTTTYSLPAAYASLIGETFTGQTSTIKMRILNIIPAEGGDPATLFVEYTDNSSVSGTATSVQATPTEILNGDTSGTNLQVQTTNTTLNPAVGKGTVLSVQASTYFVAGHFVFAPGQQVIISKYSNTPNADIGFIVTESVITASDETALYDNTNATPNLTAPGADRYKIELTLALSTQADSDTTFIEAFKVIGGALAQNQQTTFDKTLSDLGKIMATRTYEESGNYTVKPFIVKTKDNADSAGQLDITIGAGIGYVNGFRYELLAPTKITIDRPRSTETINNDVVAAEYGNYVLCGTLLGIPQVNTFGVVNLRSAITHGGSTIGSARIRAIEEVGGNYRVHLFDIAMTGANNFSAVRSVGTASTDYADLILVNSVAVLNDTTNNNLIFDLSGTRPSALTDISLTTQRRFSGTTTGSGTIQFTLSASGETFANSTNWILARTDTGVVQTVTISAGGNGSISVTLSGLPNSTAVALVAYVNKGAATVKTKTLTNAAVTFTPEADNSVQLAKADIYRINEIRAGGTVINNYYVLDNGQRDNFYAEGKLVLKSGYAAPAGNVYVDYDYFVHGAGGDFFAVNSYSGQVGYADIPTHRQKNGQIVQLRDVLDFRSRQSDTAVDFSSTGAVRIELPANTDLITTDVTYYQGKNYRIALKTDGQFEAIGGTAALYPQDPIIPPDAMELYKLQVNPFCLTENDVNIQYVDNRRYTMRDIADLETRMNRIEEITTLNLLEMETSTLEVLDSSGNNRLKIGLTADNFSDHSQSARYNVEYKASTDVLQRELRPPFSSNMTELVYDSANSQYVSLVGDTVYPLYEEEVLISNNTASTPEPINSYSMGVTIGHIKLSPSSDVWFEDTREPDKTIDGGLKLDTATASMWGDWNFNWSGITESALKAGYSETQTKKEGRTTTTVTNTVLSNETVVTSMGDEVLFETSIQYMRNRFVFFKASGLRPNTRYFPFFDGVDVSNWVRAGSGLFQYMAGLSTDSIYLNPGESYKNSTSYPVALGGLTASIISDTNGEVEGIFFIPSRDTIKFLTGDRTFTLIDISVINKVNCTSYADAMYSASGTLRHWQESIKQTRKYVIKGTLTSVTEAASQGNDNNNGGDRMVTHYTSGPWRNGQPADVGYTVSDGGSSANIQTGGWSYNDAKYRSGTGRR
jgi:hypothetical protein